MEATNYYPKFWVKLSAFLLLVGLIAILGGLAIEPPSTVIYQTNRAPENMPDKELYKLKFSRAQMKEVAIYQIITTRQIKEAEWLINHPMDRIYPSTMGDGTVRTEILTNSIPPIFAGVLVQSAY